MNKFETAADAKTFILGGSAVFTITSLKTGKHFTFKVKEKKEKELNGPNMRFVNVLAGPDNQSFDDSVYIGFIPSDGSKIVAGKKGKPDAPSFKALEWVLAHLNNDNLPEQVKIQHEGRCCRCNRVLTHPDSIDNGIGPECAKHFG